MPDPKDSPAVRSMEREQATRRERESNEDLDDALADTFPASDPVSATSTGVPSGRANAEEANQVREQTNPDEEFPLVEQALRSTGEHHSKDRDEQNESLRSLRRDVDRLAGTAGEVAAGATSLAKSEARGVVQDLEERIRAQPLKAVAVVAALAFIFGATR